MKSTFKFFTLLVLAMSLFACQQKEIFDQGALSGQPMKTVTITAGIDGADTKASLDSESGAFTWQSGDLISVLATDGNFYDFILTKGANSNAAAFEGSIPEDAEITTVATYPRIVANGSVSDGILSENTLNYSLPVEWTYAKEVSNVPMVATFGAGAEDIAFKQVGGVMRFPISNLPANTTIVFTMNDKTIAGTFPVDITALGETAMVAGTEASEVVVKYVSDYPAIHTVLNLPVPTGVYNNFTVTIKNADNEEIFTKAYTAENTVDRATLLNMAEIVLPEIPVAIAEVWPFFVDARVVFNKYGETEQFAAYIDGATEPVLVDVEDWGDKAAILIGGNFAHNTTHTVAIAKVVDGVVVPESKTEAVEFKTADIRQLTTNTGTKFVSVGWDDVAVTWGPKYVNGKWTEVSKTSVPSSDLKLHQKRGYQVQLLADDKTTVIYDLIPFDGHSAFTGAFSDSSWLGKVDGQTILIPTALSFGFLEPGKDYYFRVKTLDNPIMVDVNNGNYKAESDDSQPYPYLLTSENGGCGWSELVKLSTDKPYVLKQNEILHEGFDDIQLANDYMNWAPGVVPDLETTKNQTWDDYVAKYTPTAYPAFLQKSWNERNWTVQAFSKTVKAYTHGLVPETTEAAPKSTFNENAGSLKGWTIEGASGSEKRTAYPIFGAIRLGQSGSNQYGAELTTPPLNSDKLHPYLGTKCIVTAQVSFCATDVERENLINLVTFDVVRDGNKVMAEKTYDISALHPDKWATLLSHHQDKNNYVHHPMYFEIKHEVYLKRGDAVLISKQRSKSQLGFLVISDMKVEVVPGEYEENPFEDNGVGTAPDETNYDVYGLGEFPISFWWAPPTKFVTTDADALARYTELAESGMNLVVYNGEIDHSLAENKRIMDICAGLGLKFIGGVSDPLYPTTEAKIAAIKEHLATSPAYVGEYLDDEPNAAKFDELGAFTRAYLNELPDKEVYVNLYPSYASIEALGTLTYEEHIDQYIAKVPTKAISYDYYGLLANGNLNTSYFNNADLVRSKSLAVRKPFWVITQAGSVTGMRYPDEQEQRWSVLSNIALGSKGISYFCYWTPASDHDSYIIDTQGNKTQMYGWVQKINADIKTIGKKLLPCHADGAIMTQTGGYPLFDNSGAGRTKYGPVSNVSGDKPVLCGCFRDARESMNGDNYKGYKVMVMSEYYAHSTVNANLDIANTVNDITVTHNNTTQTVALTNTTDVTVGSIRVRFNGATLTLTIPGGEAALIEF